ncbi:lysostaphin resistance A-like protein [Patiriisocius sp. Uisw_047]|jgi:membrane protease YdiL (CAAX protease family)|uniref:CPBP family intramembrane glutamic endopeptidase n=1 Tax=Patiriisocius sp. Uisw_047 TaxID=3230969 RepID=UPI0039ECCFBA
MYIAQAYNYLHDWWRYFVVGLLVVFIATQIGSLPLIAALMIKILGEGGDMSAIEDPAVMLNVLESNLTFFLMLLSFAVGLLALYLVVKYLHKQPWITLTTSRKKTDWGRVWFGFGLIAVITIITTLLDYNMSPDNYIIQFDLVPFLILAVIGIVLVPLQTSFEEYFFRGYFMQGLGVLAGNRWVPLLVTSFLFGIMHIANPEVDKIGYIILVYYIGTGLFLGIITLMDEGLELALGFHAGNNLVGALLITADWTVFQTHSIFKDIAEPTVGFMAVVPVFVIYPLLIFIMAKRYKWTNWNEKLFGKVLKPLPEALETIAK